MISSSPEALQACQSPEIGGRFQVRLMKNGNSGVLHRTKLEGDPGLGWVGWGEEGGYAFFTIKK